jgi:hypothetical protein
MKRSVTIDHTERDFTQSMNRLLQYMYTYLFVYLRKIWVP